TLGALLVMLDGTDVTTVRDAHHDGKCLTTPVPIGHLRELRHDLVEPRVDEPVELDLAHRSVATHGETDRRADDARLCKRRIEHTSGTELGLEAVGDTEDATEVADVLTH